MTHPGHAYFLLFCEEGLPSGMFLSGGKLTTFLDSAALSGNCYIFCFLAFKIVENVLCKNQISKSDCPRCFYKWPATQERNFLKCFVRSNLLKPCVAKKPNIIPASTLQRRKALQYKQNAGILQ